MEIRKIQGAIEAILFASGEPVPESRFSEVLSIDAETTRKALQSLMERYGKPSSGIRSVKMEDSYQMCSAPQFADQVRSALELHRNTPLSQAAMEVLAVVAYNQPVTKAFVDQVRGVDCGGVMATLSAKGLIEERGRLELPGRPLLYGTTENFLRCLHISSLDELPPLPDEPQDGVREAEEKADADV